MTLSGSTTVGKMTTLKLWADPPAMVGLIQSSKCYGAPFQHCDTRRDQLAFLLVTVEALSGAGWYPFCSKAFGPDARPTELASHGERDRIVFGYASQQHRTFSGLWPALSTVCGSRSFGGPDTDAFPLLEAWIVF